MPATPLPDALVVGAGEGEVSVLVGAGEVAVEACGVGAESVALAAATPKGADQCRRENTGRDICHPPPLA